MKNAQTRISVITATRNASSELPRLYASLANQQFKNFEWIVMDGESTDSTVDLLRQLAHESPWMRFISEPDFGIYHAINKALSMAVGEYYVIAGADDVFEVDALHKYAQVAQQTNADVVLAKVVRDGKVIGGFHPHRSWISHAQVFRGSHSVGMLFRRDLHERFGYYSARFPLLADGYFLKLLMNSRSVKFVDSEFVAGTFGTGGISTTSKLQTLAEAWQIQTLTEGAPAFQLLLFGGKIIVRMPALYRERQTPSMNAS